MGLVPVPAVLQLCVQLSSEVTAQRGWHPFHVPLPPQDPQGDAMPWLALPAPAPRGRKDAVPRLAGQGASGSRGKGGRRCMRWSRTVVAGALCRAGGVQLSGGCSVHLPLCVSLPGPGTVPPGAAAVAGGAFVPARASEDRFALGSRGSGDGKAGPRSPVLSTAVAQEGERGARA